MKTHNDGSYGAAGAEWFERVYDDPTKDELRARAARLLHRADLEDRQLSAAERTEFEAIRAKFVGPDGSHITAGQTVAEERAWLAALTRKAEDRPQYAETARFRRASCWHEAGHAVSYLLRGGVDSVSVESCRGLHPLDAVSLVAGAEAAALAGFPEQAELSLGDEHALDLALATDGRTRAWLPGLQQEARELLLAHWPGVAAVAGALDRHGSLEGREVAALVSDAMWAARSRDGALMSANRQYQAVAFGPWAA